LNITQYTGLIQFTSGLDAVTSARVETVNAAGSMITGSSNAVVSDQDYTVSLY
jgi:hypothetical protein